MLFFIKKTNINLESNILTFCLLKKKVNINLELILFLMGYIF